LKSTETGIDRTCTVTRLHFSNFGSLKSTETGTTIVHLYQK